MYLTSYVAPSLLESSNALKRKFYLTWALVPELGHKCSELLFLFWGSSHGCPVSRFSTINRFKCTRLISWNITWWRIFQEEAVNVKCCNLVFLYSKCNIHFTFKDEVLKPLLIRKIPSYKSQVLPFGSNVVETQILAYLLVLFWSGCFPFFSFDSVWPLFSSNKNYQMLQHWHSKARTNPQGCMTFCHYMQSASCHKWQYKTIRSELNRWRISLCIRVWRLSLCWQPCRVSYIKATTLS